MADTRTATRLTWDDLCERFPEESKVRRELHDGVLWDEQALGVPSPVPRHQLSIANLFGHAWQWARAHGGLVLPSPMDVVFDANGGMTRQPDVIAYAPGDLPDTSGKALFHTPSWVAEVSSPSTRRWDLGWRLDGYERFGVPEHWFVDLDDDHLEVRRMEQGRYGDPLILRPGEEAHSTALPGFAVAVAELIPPR